MTDTSISIDSVVRTLTESRVSTYVNAIEGECVEKAIVLYGWNGQISAALLWPLHVCEVVTRNAVHEVFTIEYGDCWPWNRNFELSLPNPSRGYNPRADLINSRRGKTSAGKVIPELKFVFWQKTFTRRNDVRLWDPHILALFPYHPKGIGVSEFRLNIYDTLESIRLLRNRIAHHEPIFSRDLESDFKKIQSLLSYRCVDSNKWMMTVESVTQILSRRP
ncbi:hypothetical protein TUM4438_10720 [Shewanella sairae]|uniref:Abi-like protein n=1 Tax=Shewanella sairae TaxID=190310 RepID=A0ABQ4P641_9GAMM|nr:hypothetical protein [Shewanella sairae]MCL1130505.1 hypothetical protein [Shewanella sairae]GIU42947.1 hypothetical protein TUM4438_10720 [Shewanella sairae]